MCSDTRPCPGQPSCGWALNHRSCPSRLLGFRSDPDKPLNFPYTYPDTDDAETTALLGDLKAVGVVE